MFNRQICCKHCSIMSYIDTFILYLNSNWHYQENQSDHVFQICSIAVPSGNLT